MPEPNAKSSRRTPKRAAQLGVSDLEYARLLATQDGHCALCPNRPKSRRLHVDHDHRTGRVRGLLCHRDNRLLATWVTPEWLDSAWRYLVRHELGECGRLRWTIDENGCWRWARALSTTGYPVLRYHGQHVYVHRLMYLGMIPRGHHVHHRCEVRSCVNPAHLEALSVRDHSHHHEHGAATCKRGHPWTPENTYLRPDGSGRRQCRACIRLRTAAGAS